MAGTKEGGQAAAKTNKAKYGQGFYKRIGSYGGRIKGKKGGFAYGDNASIYGKIGGSISRRDGTKLTPQAKQKVRDGLKHGYKPTLDRDDYILEQRAEDMAKNQSIASKWGKARPW